MTSTLSTLLAVITAAFWTGLISTFFPNVMNEPPARPSAADIWVGDQMSRMTLEEKIGQLFVTSAAGTRTGTTGAEWRRVTSLVEQGRVGGIIFMKGEAQRQATATQQLQELAPIPLLISQDIETGLAMRLDGMTQFPSAMAVGATRDPELAYLMGRAIAEQSRAMGIHQAYAPVADVNVNPENPVINTRSFGEDPALVGALVTATARGMQDGGLIATLKHFPGHGDTDTDTHVRLATISANRARLDRVELAPFREAIEGGVMSVMTGHLSVPALDASGRPATTSQAVITDLLRRELGFDGLVVSDGMNMRAMRSQGDVGEMCVRALEAGVDQLLLTENEIRSASAIESAVQSGRLTEDRIDASVRRVLRAKVWAGLSVQAGPIDIRGTSERPAAAPRRTTQRFAPPSAPLMRRSEALARQIARRSITLIQPANGPVPLVGGTRPPRISTVILDAGRSESGGEALTAAISARLPAGGSVFSRRIGLRSPETSVSQAVSDAESADVVMVATFIRVFSNATTLRLSARHQSVVRQLIATGTPVVFAAFGSPYVAEGLPTPSAFIAAYGDDELSQEAVADALFGRIPVSGHLPVQIPGLYPLGAGVRLAQQALRPTTADDAGMDPEVVERIDDVIERAVADGAFPGATVAVGRAGALIRLQGYGRLTRGGAVPTPSTPYDLASLTKVVGTTAGVMSLVERNQLDLDERVSAYVPAFAQTNKGSVTVRHLLTHSAGLRPFYPFYAKGILDRRGVLDFVNADTLTYSPGSRSVYSDFDMIALAEVMEAVTMEPLDAFLDETVFSPLGMSSTGFRATGTVDPLAAPTEVDRIWRQRTLQGEVHDEAAAVLGGVSGHAGLFSTAEDMARFGLMLTNGGEAYGHRIFQRSTLDMFTERSPLRGNYEMGLGWMLRPAGGGESSAGTRLGPRSFGHTGFTGTSIWVDPDQQLFVILLTNRVHPSRSNNRIRQVRPRLADAVAAAVHAPADHPERALGFGPLPVDLPNVAAP